MENEANVTNGPDPSTILCKVVDVDLAVRTSFQRFVDEEKKSLEDFSSIIREELSKMELFIPAAAEQVSSNP